MEAIHIGQVPAYFSKSPRAGSGPGLILIEEIWGLTNHIANVTDRFAAEGFEVLAPDILGDSGILEKISPALYLKMRTGSPEEKHEAQAYFRDATAPVRTEEFAQGAIPKLKLAFEHLQGVSSGDIGAVGFCFGGTYTFHLAANEPQLKAAVPFYGQPPTAAAIARITCPILAFYGEQDASLIESLPALTEEMRKAGKQFESVVYPNTGHAFFNDTNPVAYDQSAAQDAWQKTLQFLHSHLG